MHRDVDDTKDTQQKNRPTKGGFFVYLQDYTRSTLIAFSPFGDSSVSNVTVSPSRRSSNATFTSELLWKKRSFPMPSAVMKPKPLSVTFLIVPFINFFVYF